MAWKKLTNDDEKSDYYYHQIDKRLISRKAKSGSQKEALEHETGWK